jgi:hypothetical protein
MKSWWNSWPGYVKYDSIEDDNTHHEHLWSGALSDSETGIEVLKRDEYILYGPEEEALLFRPKQVVF